MSHRTSSCMTAPAQSTVSCGQHSPSCFYSSPFSPSKCTFCWARWSPLTTKSAGCRFHRPRPVFLSASCEAMRHQDVLAAVDDGSLLQSNAMASSSQSGSIRIVVSIHARLAAPNVCSTTLAFLMACTAIPSSFSVPPPRACTPTCGQEATMRAIRSPRLQDSERRTNTGIAASWIGVSARFTAALVADSTAGGMLRKSGRRRTNIIQKARQAIVPPGTGKMPVWSPRHNTAAPSRGVSALNGARMWACAHRLSTFIPLRLPLDAGASCSSQTAQSEGSLRMQATRPLLPGRTPGLGIRGGIRAAQGLRQSAQSGILGFLHG